MTSGPGEAGLSRPSISVTAARQVLVEGRDEVFVFQALARHIGIGLNDIQFQPYNGKDNLREFLETLPGLADFGNIRSLAVVADADGDRRSSAARIRGALGNAGLAAPPEPLRMSADGTPPRTGWLIIPHDSPGRMLEDVCLESVKGDPAMACVDEFLQCVTRSFPDFPKENEEPKARIHAFLSSRERPDLRLGEAAQAGVWDFDAPSFAPLKNLLRLL